jgi:hypothetical protein
MHVNKYTYVLIALLVVLSKGNSSPLVVSNAVQNFLNSISSLSTGDTVNLSDPYLLDTSHVSDRPLIFEIIKKPKSETELSRLADAVVIGDSLKKYLGYDEKRGVYYYNAHHQEAMPAQTQESFESLKQKAISIAQKLLGAGAHRFVFVNTETTWQNRKGDPADSIILQTFRFTRKINGCYIIDNSAFVRVLFTGNGVFCGFEICNPELKPVALKRMVKLSATGDRLKQFASGKNSVQSTIGEQVTVKSITAEKPIQSYFDKKIGEKKYLLPYVSVLCQYYLENGATYKKFENFCVDASNVSNISADMLEPIAR